MKVIKSITIISICILTLLSIISGSKAASSDLYLNNLNFGVQINDDGSMDVTETWNIDIEDTNTLFKTFEKHNSKYSSIENMTMSKVLENGKEEELIKTNEYS